MVYGKTIHLIAPRAHDTEPLIEEPPPENTNSIYKVSDELKALVLRGLNNYEGISSLKIKRENSDE